jgi:AAHS family 4-hydroxybenzoate transporter-like MFS transporter
VTVLPLAANDLRARLDAATLSRAQILAIGVTALLSALDGYAVLAVTFAAPAITSEWSIGRAALGVVLSAGLVGMAGGSLALAPLADVVGRRVMIFCALVLVTVGMLLSAGAHDVAELSLWRVVTGLGVGVLVAVITPLAAEIANARRRALAVSVMAAGYPAGGVLGGLASALLLRAFGWPSIFIAGGLAALVLLPICAIWLSESPAFLLGKRTPDRLNRLNGLLIRWGHAAAPDLALSGEPRASGYRRLFALDQLRSVLHLTLANLLYVFTVYYVLSWLPQLVADAGFNPATASLVSGLASLMGVIGGVGLGALTDRLRVSVLAPVAMAGFALGTVVLGLAPSSLLALACAAAMAGLFLYAGIAGIYAILAQAFRLEARAAGSGFVIGVGRGGSALAPYAAGALFAAKFSRAEVSLVFAAFAALAAALLMFSTANEPQSKRSQSDS